MSYLAPQSQGRSRSKSPGGRERDSSRNREDTRTSDEPSRKTRSAYDDESRRKSTAQYEDRAPSKRYDNDSDSDDRSRPSRSSRRPDEDRYEPVPRSSKYAPPVEEDRDKRTSRRERDVYDSPELDRDRIRPSLNGGSGGSSRHDSYAEPVSSSRYAQPSQPEPRLRQASYASPVDPRSSQSQYASQPSQQPRYADYHDRQPSYSKSYNTIEAAPASHGASREYDDRQDKQTPSRPQTSRHSTRDDSDDERYYDRRAKEVQAEPRRGSYQRERSPLPPSDSRRPAEIQPARGSIARAVSPRPGGGAPESDMRKSLSRLSVGGLGATLGLGGAAAAAAASHGSGGRPPASPLQEAYHGTYQTISPLPSPLALAERSRDDDISDDDLDGSDDDMSRKLRALKRERQAHITPTKASTQDLISPRSSGRLDVGRNVRHERALSDASSLAISSHSRKSVKFYDPEDDAKRIAAALKGSHGPANFKPLVDILPWLSIDDMSALKLEYKNHAKVNGQGINLSKHIKARIPGNLGKALYAMSLGQYESDAYWANCFYQTGNSRRELLIESLIGRSNQAIREIKDQFKDKRYDDDLEKCMKSELRADKFRNAILLALEERRMPEGLQLDMRLIRDDAEDLYDALNSSRGVSESAMIDIIIVRSDTHLKEVMRYYEREFKRNFAKEMISKSKNLVGETLAHILNGALNRPMRDAILLHQAIAEFNPKQTKTDSKQGRAELLISRIIRLHWEPKHMERVKDEYERRYGQSVTRALATEVEPNMKTAEGRAWVVFVSDVVRSSDPRI